MPSLERGMQPDMHILHGKDRKEGTPHRRNVLIFKGQGFVKPGMGHALYNSSEKVRDLHARVNDILGYDLTDRMFNDPHGDLLETQHAQPATLLSNYSEQVVGQEAKHPDFIQPVTYTAGNSLGEYSALIAAGAISFPDAIALIAKRGQYMHEAHLANPGKLATPLLAKDHDKLAEQMGIVGEIAAETNIEVCLVNGRRQIVYGGTNEEMDEAAALLKGKGIKLTALKTIGAFHHPRLMAEARRRLEPDIDATEIHDAQVPVVANATGQEATSAAQTRQNLKDQMTSPVLWLPSMTYLETQGFDVKMEIGEKSTFLDMLLDHPVYDGIALSAIVIAGGITVGWKLTHPHHKE